MEVLLSRYPPWNYLWNFGQCVKVTPRLNNSLARCVWIYLQAWYFYIGPSCTSVMTVFNALIVIEVRCSLENPIFDQRPLFLNFMQESLIFYSEGWHSLFQLRRANRKAEAEFLSGADTREAAARRRADETRLTWSLLALSGVRILTDIVVISGLGGYAQWTYDGLGE